MTDKATVVERTIETGTTVNRWDRVLLVLAGFLLFIAAILGGINVWQGTQRNARIDHIDRVVTEAREAASEANQAVRDAVAAQNSPQQKAIIKSFINSLDQINKAYVLLQQIDLYLKSK